jgi:hypothetical protein
MKLYSFLALGLLGTAAAYPREDDDCLTGQQADDMVARWTSLAVHIDANVANTTVSDDFKFFADSQNFLEGTPVRPSF